jgi:DNA-binding transcriptional MerR regulator
MSETYTTAEVATHLHVSLRRLQWMDEADVLKPKRNGYQRRYSKSDVLLIALIASFRAKGASLQRLRKYLPAIKSQFEKRIPLYVVLGKDVRFSNASAALLKVVTKLRSGAYVVDVRDLLARLDGMGETA